MCLVLIVFSCLIMSFFLYVFSSVVISFFMSLLWFLRPLCRAVFLYVFRYYARYLLLFRLLVSGSFI